MSTKYTDLCIDYFTDPDAAYVNPNVSTARSFAKWLDERTDEADVEPPKTEHESFLESINSGIRIILETISDSIQDLFNEIRIGLADFEAEKEDALRSSMDADYSAPPMTFDEAWNDAYYPPLNDTIRAEFADQHSLLETNPFNIANKEEDENAPKF